MIYGYLSRTFSVGLMAFAVLALLSRAAMAQDFIAPPHSTMVFDDGRLLGTGGVTALGGAAGGGLATWAVIAGYGSRDSAGISVDATRIDLTNFDLTSFGVAAGLHDRVEISYAWLGFNTGATGALLGLGRNYRFGVQSFGAKLRLTGNLLYDQATWMPQTAIGVQVIENNRGSLLHALGARDAVGVDYYIAATKLFLADAILVDTTVRFTRANQFGVLGFGGPRSNGYHPQFEGSLAWLVRRNLALGVDFRTAPNNLAFAKQTNAYDIFAAWFVDKHATLTLAYVDLGPIATIPNQRGVDISLQLDL